MPDAANLTPVRVAFLAGTVEQNRALLERFAASNPDAPLIVVAEFAPAAGEWVAWHVLRTFDQNLAAIRAALAGRPISEAVVAVADGTGYGPLRLAASTIAGGVLTAYDTDLQPLGAGSGLRRAFTVVGQQLGEHGRTRKWLRRIVHPGEAEIPVRARAAQLYGRIASRYRSVAEVAPLPGTTPLTDGVSIVIPTRDGRTLLEAMLPALITQAGEGEIIIVDNGSHDGTATWLEETCPAIRVIESTEPLSFARAINKGVTAARFNRLMMLNNDMIVEPGFVAALNDAFVQVPNLFCSTAQIFFPEGIRREETGKAVWRRENLRDFPVRCDDPLPGEDLTPVFYGSGGCSLFDTEKLRALGGVAECYEPAYVEDMDFGYRAWMCGWPSVYCAGARVEHRHRATTSRFFTPRQLDFFVERNYLRFLIHAVGSPEPFVGLWTEAVRRLQLMAMNGSEAALDTLRDIPAIGPRPPAPTGVWSESEIFALGSGDVFSFQGRVREGKLSVIIASPYLPFPLSHGGAVRIFNLMRHTAHDHNLVLLAFCDEAVPPAPELLDLCAEVVLVRRHHTHYRRDTDRPDMVEEFDSEAFRACLKYEIARWNPIAVQLEFTWMAQYAEACRPVKTILVEHDITFDLQRQLLETGNDTGAARWELERQFEKWQRFEKDAWQRVDAVVAMSSKDANVITGNVALVANGVDTIRFAPGDQDPEPRRLLFIGAFRHLPNLLALEWFLREVWPKLNGFTLHVIAGAEPEFFLDAYKDRVHVDLNQPGIEIEAFVADVRAAYRRAELVLAPLIASAGTNIKVLEAMAMGRVVVSTPAGINGLEELTTFVALANTGDEMASAIQQLAANPARRQAMEIAARRKSLEYDWAKIAEHQKKLWTTE